jgi:UDP:flavonoid glycosyltransferase YjiC (YdhE family)
VTRRVVFYVSGHGFGHSTRVQAVINHLPPDQVEVVVRTSAPEWLYRQNVRRPIAYQHVECDVGVVQKDSVTTQIPETLDEWLWFEARLPEWVKQESQFLRDWPADLAVADIPSAAFEACAQAGIPCLGLTNFSWDWIYRDYVRHASEFSAVADRIADAYSRCDLLLRLPFYGDLSAFPRIEDVPLVVPEGRLEPGEVRRMLGVPPDQPLVCVSFGGFDFQRFPWGEVAARAPKMRFVTTGSMGSLSARNTLSVPIGTLPHCDLVRASDLVISKPGYGIVAECIGTRTPLLYTSRGDFAEYPVLVESMVRHIPCRFVAPDRIPTGEVLDEGRRFLADLSWDGLTSIPVDGAEVVARKLLDFP